MNIYPSNFKSPFKPTRLDDFVISDESSRLQLQSILSGKQPFPLFGRNAVLLWGTYGTGKTTLALFLPQLLEQSGAMVGSHRGAALFTSPRYWHLTECALGSNSVTVVNDLNERSKSMVATSPSGWHYEVLDEVDLLTPAAQASLKTAITHANSTIFVMTTNHLSKVDQGIRDRSVLVEMNQPKPADCRLLGQRILQRMGLRGNEVTEAELDSFAAASRGSIRDFGSAVAIRGIALGGVI
jgi:DNA polymerase III delta prime subunit